MATWFKLKMPDNRGRLLDRLLIWTAALLVIAIVGFAAYYYLDRRLQNDTAATVTAQHDIAAYEQAVRDNPQDPAARASLAQLYFAAGRYDEAVAQYRAGLAVDETNLVGLLGLGRAQLAAGDAAGATASFEKIITLTADAEIHGDYEEAAHYYAGSIALDQQRPADAVAHLKGAVAINPGDADAWQMLGAAYLANGDFDGSIDALSRAVVFVPNFTEAYDKLAAAYEGKGLAAEGQYARGMLAYSKGQYGDALSKLQAAVKASPDLAAAYVGLGLTHEMRSERDLAVAAFQHALQLEPSNFTAQSGLARLSAAPTPASGQQQGVTP